jgi:Ca2+-binding RTX toxin-like protein
VHDGVFLLFVVLPAWFTAGRPLRRPSQRSLTFREKSVRGFRSPRAGAHGVGILHAMHRRLLALIVTIPLAVAAAPVAADTLNGTRGNDQLVGTAGPDRINGRAGDDRLRGRAGNDRLLGGPGNDAIFGDAGADVINGGPGGDTLLGGAGNDRIAGGTGTDVIAAGNGRDVISARDGVADRISCGAGRDRVVADGQDVVAGDCEVVRRG